MSIIFSRESKSITLEVYLFPAICSSLINRLSAIIDSLTLSLSLSLCSLLLFIYSAFSFSFLGSTFNLSFHGPIDAIRIHSGPLLNETLFALPGFFESSQPILSISSTQRGAGVQRDNRKFVDSFFRHGGGYCGEGEATIRALEAPRIEAFNGNDGCRRDASFFIRRDLHHQRVAVSTRCFCKRIPRRIG